jgi:hypothetical protein
MKMAKRMRGGFNSETKNDIVRIFFLLFILALIAGLIIALLMMVEERERVPDQGGESGRPLIGGCAGTEFGCCPDGKTSKRSVDDPCV